MEQAVAPAVRDILERTFIHLHGVGEKTEQKLWERGIRTWTDYLDHPGPVLGAVKDQTARRALEECLNRREDPAFFSNWLPAGHMWRVFPAFSHRAAYLDIETCPGPGYDEVTVIGLYDGDRVRTFIQGMNLQDFETAVADYDLVVTFNGGLFDLPVIRSRFPNITLPPIHVDLRWVLRRLGLSGGLKRIEQALGISRPGEVDGLCGWDAVRLWRDFCRGDEKALETLVCYNTEDIVNLKPLMEYAVQTLSAELFSG